MYVCGQRAFDIHKTYAVRRRIQRDHLSPVQHFDTIRFSSFFFFPACARFSVLVCFRRSPTNDTNTFAAYNILHTSYVCYVRLFSHFLFSRSTHWAFVHRQRTCNVQLTNWKRARFPTILIFVVYRSPPHFVLTRAHKIRDRIKCCFVRTFRTSFWFQWDRGCPRRPAG